MKNDSISIFVFPYQTVHCGDTIRFSAQLKSENSQQYYEGKLFWTIYRDSRNAIASGEIELSTGLDYAEYIPDRPGVIQIQFSDRTAMTVARIGVPVDPEKIMPKALMPSDFNLFWECHWMPISHTPLNPELRKIPGSRPELFDVSVDCIESAPLRGILGVSPRAKTEKCPALLLFHGAGVRSARTEYMFNPLMDGCIVFDVNAHGIDNCQAPEFYSGFPEFDNYPMRGWLSGNPEKVYFLHMFLRARRAIDFITSRKEWDGKNLFVRGASQGAWQALAAAGFDRRVSALAVSIPAGADILSGGWPICGSIKELPEYVNYFDAVNFARNIHIPGYVGIGLADTTCNPDGIYALCNSYAGPLTVASNFRRQHTLTVEDFQTEWNFLHKTINIR